MNGTTLLYLAVLPALRREWIDTGKLLPVVGKTFPIADAPKVWQDHGSSRVLGKIVFIVTSL